MDDHGQMGKISFIFLHLIPAFMLYKLFLALFFGPILSPTESWTTDSLDGDLLLLNILVISVTLLGFCLTTGRLRYGWSVAVNLLTPYGSFILFRKCVHMQYDIPTIVLITALPIIWILLICKLHTVPLSSNQPAAKALAQRGLKFLMLNHIISGSVVSVFMLCIFFAAAVRLTPSVNLDNDGFIPIEKPIKPICYENQFAGFQNETWNTLSDSKKMSLLKKIGKIEATYLGLIDPPTIRQQDLGEGFNGQYIADENIIELNLSNIDARNSALAVKTVLHESFHAYQSQLMQLYQTADPKYRNMLWLRRASKYLVNDFSYQHPLKNFGGYLSQASEYDARAYADDRLTAYEWMWNDAQP